MQNNQDVAKVVDPPVLALDIGGMFIKYGLIYSATSFTVFDPVAVNAADAREQLLDLFAGVVAKGLEKAGRICGLSVCIPGPFDYPAGISLMQHKFSALHRVALLPELQRRIPALSDVPVQFLHDANAFLLGELHFGAARGFTHVAAVTLGTGIGMAFSQAGHLVNNSFGSPSSEISLWNRPYRDSCVEDYISTYALTKRYQAMRSGYNPTRGVKGIAEDARAGDRQALEVFADLGRDLGAVLAEWFMANRSQILIVGGQIAQSFDFFEPALLAALDGCTAVPIINRSALGGAAQLLGAAVYLGRVLP
jgi:glucokinase